MRIFTFKYTYLDRVDDWYEVEAEDYDKAEEAFDEHTINKEDVEVQSYSEAPWIDPQQLKLPLEEQP